LREALCRRADLSQDHYTAFMSQIAALVALPLFVAGNFYVWSLKQEPIVLFWESLGIAGLAFPALFWFVKRSTG
jgi:hypothetical protein